MKQVVPSTIERVRALKAKALGFDDYASGLDALVGIGSEPDKADLESVEAAFSMASLRRRLAVLERQVAKLEAVK